MKKTIRLTESDLKRIVKKIISEQSLLEYSIYDPKPGKLIKGDKNGEGVLKWSNAKYYGHLKNGLMDGKGSLVVIYDLGDKSYHTGQFKNNLPNGYGEKKWSDGRTYKGNFKDGKINGYGEQKSLNGATYKGNFKDGDFNGYGEIKYSDGATYKGNFKDGDFNGNGEFKYSDGATYKGNFKDGDFNGNGEYKNKKGVTFKGNFKDDTLNGKTLSDLDQLETQPKNQQKTIKLQNLTDKNFYTLEGDKSWVYTKIDDKWYASKNKKDWYDITNNKTAVDKLNKDAKITNIEPTSTQQTYPSYQDTTKYVEPTGKKMSSFSPTNDYETGADLINKMKNK